MKKKLMILMVVMVLALSTLAGCGSKSDKDQKTVTGTFMDKKDFMFTILDERGHYWGFNFDVKPADYNNVENGDLVKVTYTGTVTEVDPFDGEIISIEKIK